MQNRKLGKIPGVGLIVTVLGGSLFAQTTAPHSDSQLAHELFRLKQIDAIQAQQSASAKTPAENLWKAELLLARWDDQAKNKAELSQEYLGALTAYLKAANSANDGAWSLDH